MKKGDIDVTKIPDVKLDFDLTEGKYLNFIKGIAMARGYRFEVKDGVERMYRPDGTLALEARKK